MITEKLLAKSEFGIVPVKSIKSVLGENSWYRNIVTVEDGKMFVVSSLEDLSKETSIAIEQRTSKAGKEWFIASKV